MNKDNEKPYTNSDKWIIALLSALLFLLISSPFLYEYMNNFLSMFGLIIAEDGCPNMAGLIIHALLFMIIVRLMMR